MGILTMLNLRIHGFWQFPYSSRETKGLWEHDVFPYPAMTRDKATLVAPQQKKVAALGRGKTSFLDQGFFDGRDVHTVVILVGIFLVDP
jgi:hypothetical protein